MAEEPRGYTPSFLVTRALDIIQSRPRTSQEPNPRGPLVFICGMCAEGYPADKRHVRNIYTRGECYELDYRPGIDGPEIAVVDGVIWHL